MFHVLPASRAPRSRGVAAGGAISTVLHLGVAATAVLWTSGPPIVRVDEPPVPVLVYRQSLAPRPSSPSPATTAGRVAASAPTMPPLPDLSLERVPELPDAGADWDTVGGALPGVIPGLGVGNGAGHGLSPVAPHSPDKAWAAEQVDEPVRWRGGVPLPRYPELLRPSGLQGRVTLRFIVDTLGRVEPSSVQASGDAHPLFVRAARDAVPRFRFTPARAGTHRVRQLVELPIEFRPAR